MKTDQELVCEAVHVAERERAEAWGKGVDLGDLGSHVGAVYERLYLARKTEVLAGLAPRVAEAVAEFSGSLAAMSSALEQLAAGEGDPAADMLTACKAVEVDAMELGFMFGRRGIRR